MKPTIRTAVGVSVLFYALFIVAEIMVTALGLFGVVLSKPLEFLSVQTAGWLVTIVVATRVAKAPWHACYPLTPVRIRLFLPLLLASVGASVLLVEVVGWIPMPDWVQEAFESVVGGKDIVTTLAVVVVAPVAEELFFRGWMLKGFLHNYSARTAVLASAAAFAIFHLNPWQAVAAFPLGVGFAWLVMKTGSLIPVIFCHAVVNATETIAVDPVLSLMGYSKEAVEELRIDMKWKFVVLTRPPEESRPTIVSRLSGNYSQESQRPTIAVSSVSRRHSSNPRPPPRFPLSSAVGPTRLLSELQNMAMAGLAFGALQTGSPKSSRKSASSRKIHEREFRTGNMGYKSGQV